MKLKIKPLTEKAKEYYQNHQHFHEGDSGIDLYCVESQSITDKLSNKIDFQIQCEMENIEMDIKDFNIIENVINVGYTLVPRSSIVKTPLRMSNSIGIIDAGYRGNIMAFVDNHGDTYQINEGDRLFQIVSFTGEPLEIEIVDELSETKRGTGGFGSTGK